MVLLLVLAAIAAEGFALCSMSFGRQSISNWNIATGCYYNTSKPAYRPSWCDWSGVSCNSVYSVNSLSVWYSYWDSSSNYLAQNNLKRTIPSSLASLKGLTSLTLYYMQYTGAIPTFLFSLAKLSYLDLRYNSLSGSVPTALANLKQLNQLLLDNNRFNASLPAALLNMPHLTQLSIQSNSLTGLPSIIHKNTVLNVLLLGNNQLHGTLSSAIGNLVNLNTLQLSNNQIYGSIPSSIGNLTNLNNLDLSYNGQQRCNWNYDGQNWQYTCLTPGGFNGTLPAGLYSLQSLNSLRLIENKLSGSISPMISRLTNLQQLQLSGNSLSGTIPSSLSTFSNLYSVYLDNNRFSASIPKIFGNIRHNWNTYYLLLHNNYFTSAVPAMEYSYGQFYYTFDQNCLHQNTSSLVYLGSQTHCKPGSVGQRAPTTFPSPSPTQRKKFTTAPLHSSLLLTIYVSHLPFLFPYHFLCIPTCSAGGSTAC